MGPLISILAMVNKYVWIVFKYLKHTKLGQYALFAWFLLPGFVRKIIVLLIVAALAYSGYKMYQNYSGKYLALKKSTEGFFNVSAGVDHLQEAKDELMVLSGEAVQNEDDITRAKEWQQKVAIVDTMTEEKMEDLHQ